MSAPDEPDSPQVPPARSPTRVTTVLADPQTRLRAAAAARRSRAAAARRARVRRAASRIAVPLLIVALAAIVRLAAFAALPPERLVGDEIYYAQVARGIALGEGHRYLEPAGIELRAWRPPAHPYLLSLVLDRQGASSIDDRAEGARAMLLVQIALGSLLAAAVWALGLALFDARTALVAGVAAAFYPNLVAFSHNLWPETASALLLALALIGGARGVRNPDARGGLAVAALTGLVLGIATLTREVALGVAVAVAVAWLCSASIYTRPAALARGVAMLVLVIAVVAPWSARNTRVLGSFVPVSTIGWFAAGEGNTFERDDWLRETGPRHLEYSARYFSQPSELARAAFARSWTLEQIGAGQPTWALRKLLREGSLLLGPDSYLLFKTAVGAYGAVSPVLQGSLLVLVSASWAALAIFSALGIAAAEAGIRRLALLVLSVPLVLHLLTNATSRFRVPWLPLLLVFAAHAWRQRAELRPRIGRGGALGVAVFIGFVLLVAFPYYVSYGGRR